ncbi:MAG: hypothetical protein ACK4IY_03085, partial [Chitinophagales bacterium]
MIHEITSSGLTHVWNKIAVEENKYRTSGLYIEKNFGLLRIYRDMQGVHTSVTLFSANGAVLFERELY